MTERRHHPRRVILGTGAVLAAAAIAVVGCGTVREHKAAGARTVAVSAASPARHHPGGLPAGTRRESLRLARRLLSLLALPPGARPLGRRPVPAGLRRMSGLYVNSPSVDVHRVIWLRVLMPAAFGYVQAHRPAGMISDSVSSASDRSGVTAEGVTWSLRSMPAWASSAQLGAVVIPDPAGGSFLGADAEVVWYPRRSAAEHIDPGAFPELRIKAVVLNPTLHVVTRVIRSRQVIARLARLLNHLRAATTGMHGCPDITVEYEADFAATARGPAAVRVRGDGCLADGITVGGRAQPALQDGGDLLIRQLARLLRLPGPLQA